MVKIVDGESLDSKEIDPKKERVFFTICSKNFLAHARVLYKSIIKHYPDAIIYLALCDQVDGAIDFNQEPFEFVFLEDLNLAGMEEMASRYNITEFNTAIKPFVFSHLFSKYNYKNITYLDPDIFIVDRMHELDKLIDDGFESILTPHLLKPAEQDEICDRKILLYGIYNLGFLSLKNTEAVEEFLKWWARRLISDCVIDLERGIFVDQKWAELLPIYVPGTKILNHSGYNVAYWNLPQRVISCSNSTWYANSEPLRFLHFSGINIDNPNIFSRHSQQVTVDNIGDLKILFDYYRELVLEEGHLKYKRLKYAYSWDGEKGVNLHTPKEMDMSEYSNETSNMPPPVFNGCLRKYLKKLEKMFIIIIYGLPNAVKLSGGMLGLFSRIWQAYKNQGWGYVKIKAQEVSQYAPVISLEKNLYDVTNSTEGIIGRILYIDWSLPKPDRDSGSRDCFNMIKIFTTLGYSVTFLPADLRYENGYYETLSGMGVNVVCYPAISSVEQYLLSNQNRYDIIFIARGPVVWPYIKIIRRNMANSKIIFYTVDLHYLREMRQAELSNDKKGIKQAMLTRDRELELISECDLTILLSSEELYYVRKELPEAQLVVLPVIIEDVSYNNTPFEERKDILFIGNFKHLPNVDAINYFVQNMLPIIINELSDIKLNIIGDHLPVNLVSEFSRNPNTIYHGFIKDITPFFEATKITVAPLRYGAGIKGKIASSLMYGIPCVATSIAVEGMGLIDRKEVIVADDPYEFSKSVIEINRDEVLWAELSSAGKKHVKSNYSIGIIKRKVKAALKAVLNDMEYLENAYELSNWTQWLKHSEKMKEEYEERLLIEQELISKDGDILTDGFCCICKKETIYTTSLKHACDNAPKGELMPNWRENLQCEHCKLTNRVRASMQVLFTLLFPNHDSRIYITERVTPLYNWINNHFVNLQGSEYTGDKKISGIRNEDIMNLSFNDNSFDYLLSFDVLEHVPYPNRAFKEILRVLDTNGIFLFTAPFSYDNYENQVRVELNNASEIEYILPPEYHSNPIDPVNGSLCFQYFGWKMLDELREIGFSNVRAVAYWSKRQGYLGREQYIFIAEKLL